MVLPQNNSHLYAQVLVAVTQVEATLAGHQFANPFSATGGQGGTPWTVGPCRGLSVAAGFWPISKHLKNPGFLLEMVSNLYCSR